MGTTNWNTGDPLQYCEIVTQATAVARGGGVKNFFNVFHFRRTSTANVLVKANILAAFATAIEAKMLLALNVDYTQTQTTIRFFENPDDAVVAASRAGVGAIANDRLPDFNAAVIQLKSGKRGKSGRGSKHFGPVSEDDTIGDDLTAGANTRFTAIGTAIIAGFTDSDGNVWVPGIKAAERIGSIARYTLPLPTVTPWTDILTFTLNKSLGTMKRRKIKTVT